MKNNGISRAESTFPQKGGWGRGVKNAESPEKTRFKVVKGGQFDASFGQNRASLGAFERILIESVLKSGPKRPHPTTISAQPIEKPMAAAKYATAIWEDSNAGPTA